VARSSPGQDLVVVARPQAGELAEREGLAGVDASLAELISKAGLCVTPAKAQAEGGA
jgi:hypothetical protein